MKRKNLLALLTFLVATAALSAQTQVIAHRGYWRAPGAAQNSIVALQRADQIKCFGSECDVLQTRDGVLVVHHDAHIGPDKILIEEADYDQIKDIVLSNGETVPTLQQYLKELKSARTPCSYWRSRNIPPTRRCFAPPATSSRWSTEWV